MLSYEIFMSVLFSLEAKELLRWFFGLKVINVNLSMHSKMDSVQVLTDANKSKILVTKQPSLTVCNKYQSKFYLEFFDYCKPVI